MDEVQSQETSETMDDNSCDTGLDALDNVEKRLHELIPDVVKALKDTNRCEDVVSVLQSIASGKLGVTNISLNLLLDLGQYLNQSSSTQMRYSKATLDCWVIVQTLFKGKGIRFFSGSKCNLVKRLKSDIATDTDDANQNVIIFLCAIQEYTQQ